MTKLMLTLLLEGSGITDKEPSLTSTSITPAPLVTIQCFLHHATEVMILRRGVRPDMLNLEPSLHSFLQPLNAWAQPQRLSRRDCPQFFCSPGPTIFSCSTLDWMSFNFFFATVCDNVLKSSQVLHPSSN